MGSSMSGVVRCSVTGPELAHDMKMNATRATAVARSEAFARPLRNVSLTIFALSFRLICAMEEFVDEPFLDPQFSLLAVLRNESQRPIGDRHHLANSFAGWLGGGGGLCSVGTATFT